MLNEVAPRPHNSGHYTIEACDVSQFEQHLRAVLGLPLGDPALTVSSRSASPRVPVSCVPSSAALQVCAQVHPRSQANQPGDVRRGGRCGCLTAPRQVCHQDRRERLHVETCQTRHT